ncbi:MAG: rod shape-determining protein MreC [bacterium]
MFKKVGKQKTFILIAVIGLLIFLYQLGALTSVEKMAANVLNPIFSGFYSMGSNIGATFGQKTSEENLKEKLKEFEVQVADLTEENVRLKILEDENKILREHLNFLSQSQYQYVMSNVISRGDGIDLSGRTETIIIDKGSDDGLYEGLGVVSGRGVIVGKIMEVKGKISKVYLTSNSGCKLAAAIFGSEKTNGITEGDLGLTIKMGFIPQSAEINPSDIVVTSGLESFVPRGLIIGKISAVNKENNEMWQDAVIEPMSEFEDMVVVSVILPAGER